MSHIQIVSHENYQYRSDIYDAITDRMNLMIDKHCKVFNPRFNLQFPSGYDHDGKNKEISKLTNKVMTNLRKKGVDAQYVWVREQNRSDRPHYHVSVMLDGSKMNNVWSFKKIVDDNWNKVLGMPSDGCQHIQNADNDYNKTMIYRPSLKATGEKREAEQQRFEYGLAEGLKAARYMAKTYSKGRVPAHAREFQGSQIKKKGK